MERNAAAYGEGGSSVRRGMMTDQQWKSFFETCARVLGAGDRNAGRSVSWCAWTTFTSLASHINYWTSGLPHVNEVDTAFIRDGGVWGQPFLYSDLAHIVIPREFFWETGEHSSYRNGTRQQDITALSAELTGLGIDHRLTDLVLEVKLY